MRKSIPGIRLSYIRELREKEEQRVLEAGTSLPNKPSIFDRFSDFNKALRNNKKSTKD